MAYNINDDKMNDYKSNNSLKQKIAAGAVMFFMNLFPAAAYSQETSDDETIRNWLTPEKEEKQEPVKKIEPQPAQEEQIDTKTLPNNKPNKKQKKTVFNPMEDDSAEDEGSTPPPIPPSFSQSPVGSYFMSRLTGEIFCGLICPFQIAAIYSNKLLLCQSFCNGFGLANPHWAEIGV